MVRSGQFEFNVLSAPGGSDALYQAASAGQAVTLLEADDPSGVPGVSFVKSRPAGQPFALQFINDSPVEVGVDFVVDGQRVRALYMSIGPHSSYICYGWQTDSTLKTAWGAHIKPFSFAKCESGRDGADSVPESFASFELAIFSLRDVVPCVDNTPARASGGEQALKDGKVAKINSVTTAKPAAHEVSAKGSGLVISKDIVNPALAKLRIKYRSSLGLLHEKVTVEDCEGHITLPGSEPPSPYQSEDEVDDEPRTAPKRKAKGKAPPPTKKAKKEVKKERAGVTKAVPAMIDLTGDSDDD